jgi:hypothetical protein
MGFALKRTPTDKPFRAIVTSTEFIGCDTHFWGGRTIPCEKPDCPACNAGMPYRWHAYLACILPQTHEHVIFECPQLAAKTFEEYTLAHGALRGCLFIATRPKKAANSKVCINAHPADLANLTLPQPPDLIKLMSIIWQMPTHGVRVEHDRDGAQKMTRRHTNSRAMRDQQNFPATEVHISELIPGANGR